MLFSHVKRLCIISAPLIAAAPHNAAPTVTSVSSALPTELQQDVPSCAHSCIRTSLSERFPVACTAQGDIECLCSRYSIIGESLGEVALGCVYASCGSIDAAASAYNVCLGQKNAVLPTKTALTVVPSGTSSTTSRSSTPSTTSTSRATITSIIRTTLQTQVSSSQSVFVDSISLPASATSIPSSTPTSIAAPAATDDRPKMSPAQIAGLSVAAVAAFIIAIGLMALSVFLRRRKERKSMYMNEKDEGRRRQQSARFSHYIPVDDAPAPPAPSTRFPIGPPPPAASRDGPAPTYPRLVTPSPFSTLGVSTLGSGRTVVRPGVGTSAKAASVPMSQIGLAISAELGGCPASAKSANHPRQKVTEDHFRPVSTRTENTVFEEDEIAARRRSSKLLPTPPVPIMPIRSLQPSRLPSKAPTTSTTSSSRTVRRSELFLDIPVRHERPQPKRIVAAGLSSTGSPAPKRPAPKLRIPPSSSQQTSTTSTSTITPASAADIPDYYFSSAPPPERDTTPRQDSDTLPVSKTRKAHRSPSTTGSRTISKTSTRPTFRDSVSSQTSFETADPNDPTPEDDSSDKQLSDDNKLSPVAESPIHTLRYPKVPRASNQLVPRSPKTAQGSTRRSREEEHSYVRPLPEPSSLLIKRRGEREAVQLEQKLVLKDPFTTPTRREMRAYQTQHKRILSGNSWEHTPASKVERHSYSNSPLVNEEDVVRPLSIVKKTDVKRESGQGGEMIGLKSPVWIPHLTPTRKGDDLFISVGWGDNLRGR
ncbi:hypothetical protein BU25DRAFT_63062 [Macroventuria anomochaeta]|uniref:Uncharacterized protein n=1 Tax=Macroventuria anomochaeta TaxID=301207 RepID=A0ACB6S160_9PLEO|nr:uncharacterized protein BU25DRAFT_63062 [Macroventuria anomochaeta]KAF2627400.1 hypothetical protein BU25DRAFT_63062 [Macroventuria anomochaeta]